MKKIKISNDIIIARIKGENKLTLCDSSNVFKAGKEPKIYDLLTGKEYHLWHDVSEYLAISYFDSLKGLMGKCLDEEAVKALYKKLQTSEFKNEFKKTYTDFRDWVDRLGAALDKCDNLYDLEMDWDF